MEQNRPDREAPGDLEDFIPSPLPVGNILSESVSAYFSNLAPFTLVSLLAFSPLIAWGFVVLWDLGPSNFVSRQNDLLLLSAGLGLATFVLQPLATGAIIYGVFQRQRGQRAGLGRCLAVGLKRLPHLLAVTLLTVLALVGLAIPASLLFYVLAQGLGLLAVFLLVAALIPLLMFYCAAYLAAPAVVVEPIGPIAAFRRSFRLTAQNRGRIFGILLVLGIVQKVLIWVLEKVFADTNSLRSFGDLADFITGFKIFLGSTLLLSLVFGAIGASAAALVYYRIKVNAEGADAEQLAAIFD
jgi:hypothetical protein